MKRRFDVIVVGVGAMGAATCSALARRGLEVLGLERFDIPHALGSSGGQSRLIRQAYYEHPDYVPLLRRSYEGWDGLAERSGVEVLHRCGCLYAGRRGGDLIRGSLLSAESWDVPHEVLDVETVRERYPQFTLPDSFTAVWEPGAGFVACEIAIAALAEEALRHGAQIRAREPLLSWSAAGSGVRARSERHDYEAGSIVFTAGAWAPALLADLGIALQPTRQVMGWIWPRQPRRFELGTFPCWAIEHDAPDFEGIYYGFPLLPTARFGRPLGLKIGHHCDGEPANPDELERNVSSADEADFRAALPRYLPAAEGPTTAARVCLYTLSPDRHFVVDRHPEQPQAVVACGFSGHGFKFAPAIGEALADLATEGRSELPVGFLGLDRFRA